MSQYSGSDDDRMFEFIEEIMGLKKPETKEEKNKKIKRLQKSREEAEKKRAMEEKKEKEREELLEDWRRMRATWATAPADASSCQPSCSSKNSPADRQSPSDDDSYDNLNFDDAELVLKPSKRLKLT